jgi:hypothetical protein
MVTKLDNDSFHASQKDPISKKKTAARNITKRRLPRSLWLCHGRLEEKKRKGKERKREKQKTGSGCEASSTSMNNTAGMFYECVWYEVNQLGVLEQDGDGLRR